MDDGRIRVCIVTNIATPYRIPVYELLSQRDGIELDVLYFAEREPDRSWELPPTGVSSEVLRSRLITVRGRHIHFTPGVRRALSVRRPDVVITTGYNPGHLAAFAYCRSRGVSHVVQTDGSVESERGLTIVHRSIRRWVARRSSAYVVASSSGKELLIQYGAPRHLISFSPLAVDNERFAERHKGRSIDFLVVGRLVSVKNPRFALEVAEATARRLGRRVSLVFAGDGPLQRELESQASAFPSVECSVLGFRQSGALSDLYARSRLLLFPTKWDPWGLVVNEAQAAGTPVIVSLAAGAAELVSDGASGFILPLEVARWAAESAALLSDEKKWASFSTASRAAVAEFTFEKAADGLDTALRKAVAGTRGTARTRACRRPGPKAL